MNANRLTLFVFLALALGCGRRTPAPPKLLATAAPPMPVSAPAIPAPPPKPVPLAEFRAIVEDIKRQGTPARSVLAVGKGEKLWERRRFEAIDVTCEIKKTESPLVPYRGEITWTNVAYVAPLRRDKDDSERERLEKPVRTDSHRWHAAFSYRVRRWELSDVWWTNAKTGGGAWHSKRDDRTEADPVVDWYRRLAIAG